MPHVGTARSAEPLEFPRHCLQNLQEKEQLAAKSNEKREASEKKERDHRDRDRDRDRDRGSSRGQSRDRDRDKDSRSDRDRRDRDRCVQALLGPARAQLGAGLPCH